MGSQPLQGDERSAKFAVASEQQETFAHASCAQRAMISNSACYIMACTFHICSGDAEYAVFVPREELFVGSWPVACACASSVTMMTPVRRRRVGRRISRSSPPRQRIAATGIRQQ